MKAVKKVCKKAAYLVFLTVACLVRKRAELKARHLAVTRAVERADQLVASMDFLRVDWMEIWTAVRWASWKVENLERGLVEQKAFQLVESKVHL